MIPVNCRIKHDPEAGTYGDCVRACVASILELDAEEVPHFFHDGCDGETGMDRMDEWFETRGLAMFPIAKEGNISFRELLEQTAHAKPHYMVFGATADGGNHVVVCKSGAVVHDPAWYPVGIVAPSSSNDGMWIIMVIARR